jgi:hypothetical protein
MKRLLVISHFLSCNFGDKSQSYNLLDKLKDININIQLCNFSSFDDKNIQDIVFGKKVYSPTTILEDSNEIDNCILFTGSIGVNSSYHEYCEKIFNKVTNNIIVIGGFSGDLDKNSLHKILYLFNNEKLTFYSRTNNELELYKLLGETVTRNNVKSKYKYGGDIIINRALQYQVLNNKRDKNVFILSYYIIENFIQNMEKSNIKNIYNNFLKVLSITDRIILIDEYYDKKVVGFLKEINCNIEIIKSYDIKIISKALIDAKAVISCRLHGAVLSTILGIPTYMLPTDNNKNANIYIPEANKVLGSFKYQSFAKENLCKIIYYEDLENFKYDSYVCDYKLISEYIKLCVDTELEIIKTVL